MNPKETHKGILAYVVYMPLVFFFLILLGFAASLYADVPLSRNTNFLSGIGFFSVFSGTVLVYFAQKAVGKIRLEDPADVNFYEGPYRGMRHPTYVGLFLLSFGLSLILNSAVALAVALLQFLITRFFVIREEKLLIDRYGSRFLEYKKHIPRIF